MERKSKLTWDEILPLLSKETLSKIAQDLENYCDNLTSGNEVHKVLNNIEDIEEIWIGS
jgi:hypothetical protein